MIRRLLVSAVVAGPLLGAVGCKHKCCRSDDPLPRPFLPSGTANMPPAGVPVTPGSANVPWVGPGNLPPPDFGPAGPAPAGGPAREPLLPDPLPGSSSSRRLAPAPGAAAGVLGGPMKGPAGQTPEPPIANKVARPATTAEVAGLPGFTKIKDRVATGRKPALEGFDALKRTGYRAVVYLHPAGADTSAAREVAEKRGLSFVAVETTPEKLPAAYDAVTAAIGEKAARPVYVFDDDGLRTGAVWYLYFRTVDLENAEVSRIRARAVGLTDAGDEPRAFWAAIRQYLATR
ncbi:MAG: hypothetical protein JWO38_125 [Gemmataceae bacterium]|nr:hypothetical protein [Gemmataceae bacterium]